MAQPLDDEHQLRLQQHHPALRRRVVPEPEQHRQAQRVPVRLRHGRSGIGNVFVNAKWLYKLSGMYQLPVRVNVSAFYNARQGYPFEPP
jgi:hypothetical protein